MGWGLLTSSSFRALGRVIMAMCISFSSWDCFHSPCRFHSKKFISGLHSLLVVRNFTISMVGRIVARGDSLRTRTQGACLGMIWGWCRSGIYLIIACRYGMWIIMRRIVPQRIVAFSQGSWAGMSWNIARRSVRIYVSTPTVHWHKWWCPLWVVWRGVRRTGWYTRIRMVPCTWIVNWVITLTFAGLRIERTCSRRELRLMTCISLRSIRLLVGMLVHSIIHRLHDWGCWVFGGRLRGSLVILWSTRCYYMKMSSWAIQENY